MGFFVLDKESKLELLKGELQRLGCVAIAFSGGVDSTFLLKVALDVLNENVLAITNISPIIPSYDRDLPLNLARLLGAECVITYANPLDDSYFLSNPSDRCYICKRNLFTTIKKKAEEKGFSILLDGANADDIKSHEWGMKAAREIGVRSPLMEVGLTKVEIRELAKKMNLPNSDKPSNTCLVTRIPFNEKISSKKLAMIDEAESYLRTLGIKQVRVRCHGRIARIEVSLEDFDKVLGARAQIVDHLKKIGFVFVDIDLEGYRAGSLSELFDRKDVE